MSEQNELLLEFKIIKANLQLTFAKIEYMIYQTKDEDIKLKLNKVLNGNEVILWEVNDAILILNAYIQNTKVRT